MDLVTRDHAINDRDSDSEDSNFEDEDILTKIVPPEGKSVFHFAKDLSPPKLAHNSLC